MCRATAIPVSGAMRRCRHSSPTSISSVGCLPPTDKSDPRTLAAGDMRAAWTRLFPAACPVRSKSGQVGRHRAKSAWCHLRTFPCSRRQTTRNFSKWSAVRFLGYLDRLECPTALSQGDSWRSLGRGRKPNFYLQYLGRENSIRGGHQTDGVLIANPQQEPAANLLNSEDSIGTIAIGAGELICH